jgi:hypothetical protein
MTANLRYYFSMTRLNWATVATFGVLLVALTLAPAGWAQINGVPASVTSIGFGGHAGPHGVAPSVTSIGPRGLVPNNTQFPLPGTCCINPLFPSQANPGREHHHHSHQPVYGGYGYAVPYAIPYYSSNDDADSADEPYNGGPTVFDRRGSGQPAPYQGNHYADATVTSQPATNADDEPAADQPQTVLVFKDGHQIEVSNYAIVGSTLYDLTPGHSRRVPLTDLNLTATAQQNDNRGIDFQVPAAVAAN